MEQFLNKIAETFSAKENLSDYKFVLPNRRSCTFLKKHFVDNLSESAILPNITTISDFISEQGELIELDRIELLFALYNVYKDVKGLTKSEIDKFLYWGDIILNDFNDVDMYMANASEVFSNLKNLKEINADYITKEQSDVIYKYWGEFRAPATGEHLWKENAEKYSSLWAILLDLYNNFREGLIAKGVAYSGLLYRTAAEKISQKGVDVFGFKNIVFVGFSTLSKSEETIFRHFQKIGIGDFYWDFNSPVFKDKNNRAVMFVGKYIKEYKSKYDIGEHKIEKMPNVNIVSVPSGSGQAKVVRNILKKLKEENEINISNLDTAIVLPEEKYLNSILYSVPSDFEKLNITMGFPLSQSVISSFIDLLNRLLSRSRKVDEVLSFYYEDVNALLSHQFMIAQKETVEKLRRVIIDKHYFFVPKSEIVKLFPDLEPVFDSELLSAKGKGEEYVAGIFRVLNKFIKQRGASDLEKYFISQYEASFERVKNISKSYNAIEVNGRNYIYLIDRMLSSLIVPFEGEPLEGLQIMGILETRLLDFKNIIILSMNEKVFPSKSYKRSFIPPFLRAAFDLSTRKNQDAMFAYYFYRMISRAENVYLLYDSRIQGISNGEESRFVSQLEKLYMAGKAKREIWSYSISTRPPKPIVVAKSPSVMNKLNEFKVGQRYLSASSLSKYKKCSLMFYLSAIEGIKEEDDIEDFIGSATFGSVVHKALENIYSEVVGKPVTKDFFNELDGDPDKLKKHILSAINSEYKKASKELDTDTATDDIRIIYDIVNCYIQPMLKHDRELKNFQYIGSEVKDTIKLELPGAEPFNFKYIIDRIDRVAGTLRIVDYKTGGDDNTFGSVEDIFEKDKKAIFQTLLYCYAYSQKENIQEDIQPEIYKFRSILYKPKESFGIFMAKTKEKFVSYKSVEEEFVSNVATMINEIFDPTVPFKQTDKEANCAYCPFVKLCSKK